MSEQSETSKAFVLVEEPEEFDALLREAVKTTTSTIIWTKDQDKTIRTHFSGYFKEAKSITVWLPKEIDQRSFTETYTSKGVKEFFFSLSLPRANIFFKTVFLGFDTGILKFKIPEQIFKVQRRTDFRMPIPTTHTLYVDFVDPLDLTTRLQKKVFDVSAGGLSFVIKKEEEGAYLKNMMIPKMAMTLKSRKIVVGVEVRYVKDLEIKGSKYTVKVGVQFKDIKPGDADHIAAYVLEESRKYFSRFY